MMKKGFMMFGATVLCLSAVSPCQATIISPYGPGQIGLTSVVLCESLSLRQEASADSAAVKTLNYGDRMIVLTQKDGWAQCTLSDSVDAGPAGWVNTEYVAIDPYWYRTDTTTPVYAWNDTGALKVAELNSGTELPMLKDDGAWVVVSLRGASGWIYKNDADRAGARSRYDLSSSEQSGNDNYGQSQNTFGQSSSASSGQSSWTGADFGEGAGLEDNWADAGYSGNSGNTGGWTGADFGEGAGLEDNWAGLN